MKTHPLTSLLASSLLMAPIFVACGGDDEPGGGSKPAAEDKTDIDFDGVQNGGSGQGGAQGSPEVVIFDSIPDMDYVAADEKGGWKVVGALADVKVTDSVGCGNVLRAIARDFPASHPDFQNSPTGLREGIVADTLGDDRKPEFAGANGDEVQDQESFDQWYRNVEGENIPFVIDFWLEPVGDTFVFDSSEFFPLVDRGYANANCNNCAGQADGFHFTTELHTSFEYKGGEVFTFRGDDDVWVYLNGQLAIDLGGIHGAEEASVDLDDVADDLGLEVGKVYNFDLFQAERRTSESNFRIETTLDFTNCGQILDDDVIVR